MNDNNKRPKVENDDENVVEELDEINFQDDERKLIQSGHILNQIRRELGDIAKYIHFDSITTSMQNLCVEVCIDSDSIPKANFNRNFFIRYFFKTDSFSLCEYVNKSRPLTKQKRLADIKKFIVEGSYI